MVYILHAHVQLGARSSADNAKRGSTLFNYQLSHISTHYYIMSSMNGENPPETEHKPDTPVNKSADDETYILQEVRAR